MSNLKKVPLTCMTLPHCVEIKTHQIYPNINTQHVGCSAEFGEGTICHHSPNQTLPSVCAGRGRTRVPNDQPCACTLGVINKKCEHRWDFGSVKYLTGKQKLPLWPRHGFNSTINVTCVARSWASLHPSPSWGKQPDLACLGQEDQPTCQSPSSSSSQCFHTQKTAVVTYHCQSFSNAHF